MNKELEFSFTVDEINYILSVLGKQPMETVEGIVLKIRTQADSQVKGEEA